VDSSPGRGAYAEAEPVLEPDLALRPGGRLHVMRNRSSGT
jgi:hypothetical protein